MSAKKLPIVTRSHEALAKASELLQPGFGEWAYERFAHFNAKHFSNDLQPCPIIAVPVAPYGHWVGLARGDDGELHGAIYIKMAGTTAGRFNPGDYQSHILLHEMLHRYLSQRGEQSKHDGAPWCREIMRIGREMGLPDFYAAPERVTSRKGKSVRVMATSEDGVVSLPRRLIANFPHFAFDYQEGRAVQVQELPTAACSYAESKAGIS